MRQPGVWEETWPWQPDTSRCIRALPLPCALSASCSTSLSLSFHTYGKGLAAGPPQWVVVRAQSHDTRTALGPHRKVKVVLLGDKLKGWQGLIQANDPWPSSAHGPVSLPFSSCI